MEKILQEPFKVRWKRKISRFVLFFPFLEKYFDFSELTEANISSLRWDNVIADPLLDQDRIEQYKELRRQRYAVARKQAIEHLIQRIRLTEPTVATQ